MLRSCAVHVGFVVPSLFACCEIFDVLDRTQCTDADSTTACTAIDESAVKSAASAADVLVYLVGTGEKIESEVVDHGIGATLKLPGKQEQCAALLAS